MTSTQNSNLFEELEGLFGSIYELDPKAAIGALLPLASKARAVFPYSNWTVAVSDRCLEVVSGFLNNKIGRADYRTMSIAMENCLLDYGKVEADPDEKAYRTQATHYGDACLCLVRAVFDDRADYLLAQAAWSFLLVPQADLNHTPLDEAQATLLPALHDILDSFTTSPVANRNRISLLAN